MSSRSLDSMLSCPAPLEQRDVVELAHGGGGRKTARLIETLFAPAFRNPQLEPLGDGAILELGAERLAFSTDTFVVKPAFFPGGDIGSLAVHGTVNDLAMCGAQPLFLSAGYLL
ncbi:MAG: AIR synthase related protein, partial [Betaproteobacteria bacterium]